jgi:hypothetical protein
MIKESTKHQELLSKLEIQEKISGTYIGLGTY